MKQEQNMADDPGSPRPPPTTTEIRSAEQGAASTREARRSPRKSAHLCSQVLLGAVSVLLLQDFLFPGHGFFQGSYSQVKRRFV